MKVTDGKGSQVLTYAKVASGTAKGESKEGQEWIKPKGRKQELVVKSDGEKDASKVWEKIKSSVTGGSGL